MEDQNLPLTVSLEFYLALSLSLFISKTSLFVLCLCVWCGRRGGLVDSKSRVPGSSPGLGHCVVFLGKTLYSLSASLHPGV